MALIGSLVVSVSARTKKFEQGLSNAKRRTADFGKQIGALSTKTAAYGAAVGVLGGTVFAALAKSTANNIDRLAKLSDRIGTTTERLTGLQHAADITGAGGEKLAAGLDVMAKRLGEASRGSGAAKAALDELGLSASELIAMDPADAFSLIADRVAGLDTQSQKAAATANIFSRANQDLVNTLALGSQGLRDMEAEAEKLGLTFSRVDAAKVEAANDSLTRVSALIRGAMRTAVIELAPFVEAAANKLVEMGTAGEGMGPKVVRVIRWVLEALAELVKWFEIARGAMQTLVGAIVTGFGGIIKAVSTAVDLLTDVVEILPGVEFEFDDDFQRFADSTIEWGTEWVHAGIEAIDTADNMKAKIGDFFDSISQDAEENARATLKAAEAQRALGEELSPAQALAVAQATREQARAREAEAAAWERQHETLTRSVEQRERVARMTEDEKRFASEILEIEQARADGMVWLAARLDELLALKETEYAIEQAQAELERQLRQERLEEDRRREQQRRADEALETLKERLRLTVELGNAADEFDRRRIQAAEELRRNLEAAGEDQEARMLAQEAHAQRLRDIENDRAEAAERTADAIEKQATATEKVAKAASKSADKAKSDAKKAGGRRSRHRKDFVNVGGSPFGFSSPDGRGKGLFGNFMGGPVEVREARIGGRFGPTRSELEARKAAKKAEQQAAEAAAGVGSAPGAPVGAVGVGLGDGPGVDGMGDMPDPTASIEDTGTSIEGLKEKFGTMTDAADKLAAATEENTNAGKDALAEVAKTQEASADKIAELTKQLEELRETQKQLQQQLAGNP